MCRRAKRSEERKGPKMSGRLTSNSTPLPSTLAKIRPFGPPAPPLLILTNPVPIFSHFPPANLDSAPFCSQAVSSPSSPTPCSISVGSDGIVGAGASSPSAAASVAGSAAEGAVVEGAAEPNEKEEVPMDFLGVVEAAPKEKLGAPPGRRWKEGVDLSAGGA